jgi:two-component system sensor histidine kinase PhcS
MLALATQNDDLYVAPAAKPKREQAISEPLYSHQPSITLDDPEIAQRFVKEDRGITLRNVRRLCWIAMILIPAAVVLDWFAYPHLIEEFFLWRVMSTLCLISVLFAAHTRWGKRNYRLLTVVVPMIPAFFISLMIRATHDPSSGYYAGLTLCLVALALMFHWTFIESIAAVITVLILYITAVYEPLTQSLSSVQIGNFVNNCVFIILNSVVITSASFYHCNIRVREFLTRMEGDQQRQALSKQNEELSTTLKQLRETENQLVQSDKLASLGRISAGIIHEINNPLSYANQALFVLGKKIRKLPEDTQPELERVTADIKDGITRVSSVISDLRSFSHPDSGHLTEVPLADTVANAIRIMANQIREAEVEIELQVDPTAIIMADRNHIIQVLINLTQNAIDAMQGREHRLLSIRSQDEGERLQLTVRDSGTGIPHENLPRVFDPFFTTKDVGEGMGMGLAICYRLIQQMGARIDVNSHPGFWTEFTLSLATPTDPDLLCLKVSSHPCPAAPGHPASSTSMTK